MRIIVAVTGASGSILAKRLLEVLRQKKVETLLVVSEDAKKVMEYEGINYADLKKLASKEFKEGQTDASIASGSFETDGMAVIPCSMKTLAGLASGYADNLILRAGDVCLKQERKLVLVPRETPLSYIHLRNMLELKTAGAIIVPPNLTFYSNPKTLEDAIDFAVGKVLDSFNIKHNLYKRWS